MNSAPVSMVIAGGLCGAVALGMLARRWLPEHQLTAESDAARVARELGLRFQVSLLFPK